MFKKTALIATIGFSLLLSPTSTSADESDKTANLLIKNPKIEIVHFSGGSADEPVPGD
ncbi:hypothetical protein [Cytobacillus sp. IB215665]|uniref:hypothetical protein n=1 Tax=Cytobacillus sp. IB215665 TaxID=3097357 RepID=UPI002A0CD85C|nr:hypothetical protein [Cytobacillus sp. IB215665]MDX8367880.1 hypothetical protein [Cytobacillus sp. IB215665]